MAGPARITIELEAPPHPRGRWRARTRIDTPGSAGLAPFSAPVPVVEVVEPREPAVEPLAYEPVVECTCVEGYCDADHANE